MTIGADAMRKLVEEMEEVGLRECSGHGSVLRMMDFHAPDSGKSSCFTAPQMSR